MSSSVKYIKKFKKNWSIKYVLKCFFMFIIIYRIYKKKLYLKENMITTQGYISQQFKKDFRFVNDWWEKQRDNGLLYTDSNIENNFSTYLTLNNCTLK